MQKTAVFVDAGYLFAAGANLLTGSDQARHTMTLNVPRVVHALKDFAGNTCPGLLLRIYWYDALRANRASREQTDLADTDDVKVRLGQVNVAGEQKGVDPLIITDLLELARNGAVTDVILVSGDEDLRVGVVLAQQFGVRVHLLGLHPARSNQSRSLRQEADTTHEMDAAAVGGFLSHTPPNAAAAAAAVVAMRAQLDTAVVPMVAALPPEEITALKQHFATSRGVPQDYDRALLRVGRQHFGEGSLEDGERAALREAFARAIAAA